MGFLSGPSGSVGSSGGAVARLMVLITGNSSQLQSSLAGATSSLAGFQGKAAAMGSALTRSLTVPLLAIGAVSIKLAMDFEAAMARLEGLTPIFDEVGVSVQSVSEDLFALSATTATSVTQLADTLYFAGSAGLDYASALDVVEMSAKGAAMGMGEAEDIARTLVAAMNNWGTSALSAAQAMDALTMAIRLGLAEPDEFAISLGRLMPVAKAVGMTFQETVASVAALTNLGMPTRVATTSLRALLDGLSHPSIAAKEALDSVGISASDMAAAIDAGPLVAMNLLTEAFDGNMAAVRAAIPTIRGYTAYLALAGTGASNYNEILQELTNSQGIFKDAWEIFQQTPQVKWQQTLANLQSAGIRLGQALLPVFTAILGAVNSLATAFAGAGKGWQTFAAAALVAGAAMGPLLKVYAAVVNNGAGMFTSIKSTASAMMLMAAAAAAAAMGLSGLMQGQISVTNVAMASIGAFIAFKIALQGLVQVAQSGALGVNALFNSILISPGMITGVAAGLALVATAIAIIVGRSKAAAKALDGMKSGLAEAAAGTQTMAQYIETLAEKSPELAASLEEVAAAAGTLDEAVGKALPQTYLAGVQDIVFQLQRLGQMEGASSAQTAQLQEFASALQEVAVNGGDMGAALEAAGSSSAEFFDYMRSYMSMDPQSGAVTEDIINQAQEMGHLAEAYRQFIDDGRNAVVVNEQLDQVIAGVAETYGVSVEEVNAAMNESGLTAMNLMDAQTVAAMASAAGWVDSSGKIVGSLEKIRAALQQTVQSTLQDMNEFEKVPDKVNTAFATLEKKAMAHMKYAMQTVKSVQTLLKNGMSSSQIDHIMQTSGAGMVNRLAEGSKGQMSKLVAAYEFGLEAVDNAILKEGDHEFVKGKGMMDSLTSGIINNQALAPAASQKIMDQIANNIDTGKLTVKGMQMAQGVAEGILNNRSIPEAAAQRMVAGVYQKLASNPGFFENAGYKKMVQFSAGIQKGGGKAQAQTTSVMRQIQAAALGGADLRPAGYNLMTSLSAGIQSAVGGAIAAGVNAVSQVVNAMEAAAHASPQYFTYHMGTGFFEDLEKGMKEGQRKMESQKKLRPLYLAPFAVAGGSKGGNRGNLNINVTMDRKVFTRNLDYSAKLSGL